jgi:hypothetical protein
MMRDSTGAWCSERAKVYPALQCVPALTNKTVPEIFESVLAAGRPPSAILHANNLPSTSCVATALAPA